MNEDLDDSEKLEISVDFLKYKSADVFDAIKSLIPRNLADDKNRTLLHWAALKGQLEKVRFLIDNDLADTNIRDAYGYNCFELSCKKGYKEVMAYLKSLGLVCDLPENKRFSHDLNIDVENRITACMYADNPEELQNQLRAIDNPNGYFSIPEYYE